MLLRSPAARFLSESAGSDAGHGPENLGEIIVVADANLLRHSGDGQGKANGPRRGARAGTVGDCLHNGRFLPRFGHNEDHFLLIRQGHAEKLIGPLRSGAFRVQNGAAAGAGRSRESPPPPPGERGGRGDKVGLAVVWFRRKHYC